MPTFDLRFTLDEITSVIKSVSRSLHEVSRKLPEMREGRSRDEAAAEYRALTDALDALRDAQEEALLS